MRYSRLAIIIGGVFFSGSTIAHTWTFDPDALGKGVDISLLNEGVQPPGTYAVDILLNGERVDSRDIVFSLKKNARGEAELLPCLNVEMLNRYGIRTEDYPTLVLKDDSAETQGCIDLSAIPQSKAEFQFNNQQLLLSIPQVALRPKLKGIAPQQLWDDGIPALLLNYDANTNSTEYRNGDAGNQEDTYVQLNPGANLGAWRLRNQTSWRKQGQESGKWQTVQTYAERGLYDLKSRLTLGDRQTPGDIFDSVPFRGVMLGSDDNMIPFNQREFAPAVHGIARTQARVEVRQNGYVIYSDTVAPGPFSLTDLSVPGTGGDLQVTVRESDGQVQVFSVPYQTPAIAVREGHLKYNFMTGEYRPAGAGIDTPMIGQAAAMYGLPGNLTIYGGIQGAEHYQSVAVGLGLSMGAWGSISLDTAQADGERKNRKRETGNEWHFRFSKLFDTTDTTFTLGSYQYASEGYNSLTDVLDSYGGHSNSDDWWYYDENERRKSKTSLTVNQSMGSLGYLYTTGTREDYWNKPGHEDSYSLGYGIGLSGVSVNLNWSKNKRLESDGKSSTDNLTTVSVSVPLDRWLGGSTFASYQMTSSAHGGETHDVGLNGQAFDRQLNWNVHQSYQHGSSEGNSNASAMDATWFGGYGQIGANYRYSPDLRQMGGDVAGGIIVHSEGITFGQPLNDTIALVETPGASGVRVNSGAGISTDFRGYTTESMVTPYQENIISLDPTGMASDAEITQTDVKVIPTAGAVIPAKFSTRVGARALMTIQRVDGSPAPFGAVVNLEGQGGGAGIVGDAGQVYLTGLPEKGELTVKWSDSKQCNLHYILPKEKGKSGMYMMNETCR